ncbi:hypothetical protein TFLX_05353 [Thermoflexales bacterium]|nr:hypothetical protein TFLX_05353 [Thermoflexales bacterium]
MWQSSSYSREKLLMFLNNELRSLDSSRDDPEEMIAALGRHRRYVDAMPEVHFNSAHETAETWAKLGDLAQQLLYPEQAALEAPCLPAAECYTEALRHAPERADIQQRLARVKPPRDRKSQEQQWTQQLLSLAQKAKAARTLEEDRAEARRIGSELNWLGGMDLMRKVAHQVQELGRSSGFSDALGFVERWWSGIGDWRS